MLLSIYRKKGGIRNCLETLAKTLCPHLGSKGSIAHDEIQCGYRGMFDIQGNLMKTVDMGLSIASTPHWHKLIKCFLRGFLLEVCYYQCLRVRVGVFDHL
ncbi:hypothetical protein ACJX0J_042496 [Zea mays]